MSAITNENLKPCKQCGANAEIKTEDKIDCLRYLRMNRTNYYRGKVDVI